MAERVQKVLITSSELWSEIEAFRFDNRIKSETEAMRMLIRAGLDSAKKKTTDSRRIVQRAELAA
jgi:hypothetical protein